MSHTTLDPKHDKAYWEFSFTEMGLYDAPAFIDHIRNETGQSKVSYIGHSQGTSQMFSAMSQDHEFWKERLNVFIALAPVTKLTYTGSELFKFLSEF